MKLKLGLLLTSSLLTGCAAIQVDPSMMKPISESEKTITSIVEVKGMKKEKIFSGTKLWIAETFRSAKQVIELEDKENNTIIGNGEINYPDPSRSLTVPFTIRIDIKDEKYKVTFTNINIKSTGYYSSTISVPASNLPVSYKYDMNLIRPRLIELGNDIAYSLTKEKSSTNW